MCKLCDVVLCCGRGLEGGGALGGFMAIGWHAVLFEDTRVTQQRKKELWSNTTLKLLQRQRNKKENKTVATGELWKHRAPCLGSTFSLRYPGRF